MSLVVGKYLYNIMLFICKKYNKIILYNALF